VIGGESAEVALARTTAHRKFPGQPRTAEAVSSPTSPYPSHFEQTSITSICAPGPKLNLPRAEGLELGMKGQVLRAMHGVWE
jgi:hypothetical protein